MKSSPQTKYYENKIYGKNTFHAGRKERLAACLLDPVKQTSLLDIGCGPGRFLKHIETMGINGTGVDVSQAACSEAINRNLDVRLGSAETLDTMGFEENSFDVISLLDVLEHTFSPADILQIAAKFLKEDGFFLISVPNIACIEGRVSLLRGIWPLNDSGLFDESHLRWFTRKNLDYYFSSIGTIEPNNLLYLPLEAYERHGLWRSAKIQQPFINYFCKMWPELWAYEFIFLLQPFSSK